MHFAVYFVFAAVQIPDGGMMVWIVGVIMAYHGKYMYMASMCLQRSLLRTCISRTPRGGVQSQKVFWFAGACISFCMSASPPSQSFLCSGPCGLGTRTYMRGLGLVCYRGSSCSSSSSLNALFYVGGSSGAPTHSFVSSYATLEPHETSCYLIKLLT